MSDWLAEIITLITFSPEKPTVLIQFPYPQDRRKPQNPSLVKSNSKDRQDQNIWQQ
ncbi:hypothetical protein [Methylobacter marinus]|uniref:hypothetical protein n=1 Tax=Methylobacter marinus TaxID=34058 RepID=UPI0012EBAAC3|nr:hypothetical protein [Methylobacter marinus]